jgi:hypothetical protein
MERDMEKREAKQGKKILERDIHFFILLKSAINSLPRIFIHLIGSFIFPSGSWFEGVK